jgi:archaellum component FlaC
VSNDTLDNLSKQWYKERVRELEEQVDRLQMQLEMIGAGYRELTERIQLYEANISFVDLILKKIH